MHSMILREGERADAVPVDGPVAQALTRIGLLELRTEANGRPVLCAGAKVGVVTAGALQVIVRPKLDIARIVFLMSYARRPGFWRDDSVRLDPQADLVEMLADEFIDSTRRALAQGPLKGYHTVDDALPLLRGRVREGDQLRRHFGRPIPLEVRFDEYSVDTPENQILRAAAELLLKAPRLGRRMRGPLQRMRLQLSDVSRLRPGAPLPAWTPSRLNARYQPALALAELILAGQSFEQRVGQVLMRGFLLDMAKLFEDFVTVALSQSFRRFGGVSRTQCRTHLDVERQIPIRPDFVWEARGVPQVVVDAKYKAEKPSGFPNADFYQLLAYATVLGLPEGHLIYAKGNEQAREHHVQVAGTRLVAHALDLEREPNAMLADIDELVDQLLATSPSASLSKMSRSGTAVGR